MKDEQEGQVLKLIMSNNELHSFHNLSIYFLIMWYEEQETQDMRVFYI